VTYSDDDIKASLSPGGKYLFTQKDGTAYGCDISGTYVTADEIGLYPR
jgi:hypothetical protein